MGSKFRKIDPRIWRDEKFTTLAVEEKLVAVYCLTAQSNRCGIFVFSPAMAAEELGIPLGNVGGNVRGTFRERFGKVVSALRWRWDDERRVLYFPTWWKYNPPENANVLLGNLKDVAAIPETPLLAEFSANVRYLPEALRETFRERMGERYPKPSPQPCRDQEQEQEQEKEQKQEVPAAAQTLPLVTIPPELDTEEFRAAWGEWKADRAERGIKAYTPRGETAKLKELAPYGPAVAVAAIRTSIGNQWQGLFPEKVKLTGGGDGGGSATGVGRAGRAVASQGKYAHLDGPQGCLPFDGEAGADAGGEPVRPAGAG